MRDDVNTDRDADDGRDSGRAGAQQADVESGGENQGEEGAGARARQAQGDAGDAKDAAEADSPDGGDGPTAGAGSATAAEDAQRTLDELRDKYLRLAAEFENYRRRSTRERQEAGSRAQAELIRQIVDSLDDLARVASVDPSATDVASIVRGVDLVEKKLVKALTAAGLEIVNPVDQAFDPARHEAVGTEPALSPEDDHLVARVYQPAYVFNGQLLRPARVVVKQWNG